MPNIDNEGFKTIYRPPYSIEASACGVKCGVKMLNKYYDTRKDGEIVNVVALTEPYNIIGSHAFDFCHVKELTIPDTVTQLKRFAFTFVAMLTPAGFSSLQLCRNCAKFRKTVIYVMFRLITDAEVPFFCETALQQRQRRHRN